MIHVPAIEILPWEKLAWLRYFRRTIVERLFGDKRQWQRSNDPGVGIEYHSKANGSYHCFNATSRC